MTIIESKVVYLQKSDKYIYEFISDFRNFIKLMPHQIKDIKITHDTCSFRIEGIPTITLKINEKIPFSCVKMQTEDSKLPFTLNCILKKENETECAAQFCFEAKLNPMMKMMVAKPLRNFLDLLADKLKEIKF